ncbi:putative pentatricopeptide repeat-containing protein At3g18840 [Neltuma alba]|uniref:putative pentatricopeptide repeat-containing protein At3g18840 n=1 Tax=Neltuma alba TaxID=207710 RepID=UPI0010A508D6|nr:putative pentatricopeptide repeat-containing protein At3g18840 [Prosopis alba]
MKSLRDVMLHHAQVIKAASTSNIFALNEVVRLYANHGLPHVAQKLFDEMPQRNVFSWNTVISAHIKARNLAQARALFDSAPHKDSVSYNSMLSGYVSADGYETEALNLFTTMQSIHETTGIDEITLTTMINLATKLRVALFGRQIHSYMVKTANDGSAYAVSSLIDMYSKCGLFGEACNVFSGCNGEVDLISKNAMLAACFREGKMGMALNIFWESPELNDIISWNTLIAGECLGACSGLQCLALGKSVHAWVLKNTSFSNQFISNAIVDLYCKCGNLKYAESVNAGTKTSNLFAVASFISGYSSQGNMRESQRLFDSLTEKNSVVWTALISGYVKAKRCDVVFKLFREYMTNEALVPDGLVIISVLGACAIEATLTLGKQIHAHVLRMGIEMNEKLPSALVDMYSKCGNIEYAEKIFHLVAGSDRDTVFYNIMIAGFAHHGLVNEAFKLFQEMLKKHIKPDAVTFVALLSACVHRGLVNLGEQIFCSMEVDHNILPGAEHYACMVDMYGRANKLEKAIEFMRKIPVQMDVNIWGAFFHACRLNGNIELAKEAAEKLLKVEADNGSRYVQLANVYASEGNWDEMGKIRNKMRGKEARKLAGCSWMYVENGIHVFTSGDSSHSTSDEIYSALVCLKDMMYFSSAELEQLYEDSGEFF